MLERSLQVFLVWGLLVDTSKRHLFKKQNMPVWVVSLPGGYAILLPHVWAASCFHVGAGHLWDQSSFSPVSFVVGYFPDFLPDNHSCLMTSSAGVVGHFLTLQFETKMFWSKAAVFPQHTIHLLSEPAGQPHFCGVASSFSFCAGTCKKILYTCTNVAALGSLVLVPLTNFSKCSVRVSDKSAPVGSCGMLPESAGSHGNLVWILVFSSYVVVWTLAGFAFEQLHRTAFWCWMCFRATDRQVGSFFFMKLLEVAWSDDAGNATAVWSRELVSRSLCCTRLWLCMRWIFLGW